MELLVLIVPDAGLRSALVGRLSLLGESVVTLTGTADERMLDRLARTPAMLIVDAETIGDRLEAMRDDPRWAALIVLADAAQATASGTRFRILDRERALDDVVDVLAGWRRSMAA